MQLAGSPEFVEFDEFLRWETSRGDSEIVQQQTQLLNLRLMEEINSDTYAAKATELRDEEADLRLRLEAASRSRHETIDLAIRAFELSQNLRAKWFEADVAAKRRILEIICLNWVLDGVSLVPEMRKPFDLAAEGLQKKGSRGDSLRPIVDETGGIGLALTVFPPTISFDGDAVLALVEGGLYTKRGKKDAPAP